MRLISMEEAVGVSGGNRRTVTGWRSYDFRKEPRRSWPRLPIPSYEERAEAGRR